MALEQNRFLHPHQPPSPRRKRWGGCWGGMPFFSKKKRGKRIVPSSRVPEANALSNQQNGPQPGELQNQMMGITIPMLAPPSSPASFSNSGIPSTAPSPNCYLSANSPEGTSSTMFVTGPYAHETQLVSPPVFSTFTTEPSTAPLTPPPELAHLTTPSSPDVPYAHFLLSSAKMKSTEKTNDAATDLQAAYSLSPGSPASALRSPVSRESGDCLSSSFNEREFATKSRQDNNIFCPETFAQFYDQSSSSNAGGRLSISKESDAYLSRPQNKPCRPDAEELDAYRASFGFSADEIITTANYVEISEVLEDFSMTPTQCNKSSGDEHVLKPETVKGQQNLTTSQVSNGVRLGAPVSITTLEDESLRNHHTASGNEDIFSKMGSSRINRKHHMASSNSDAEIEYRRGRSIREGRNRRES